MRYVSRVAALLAAVCIVVAAPAAANPVVPQNKIDSLLLSDDDVSSIVGLPLRQVGKIYSAPGRSAPLPERDDCRSFLESDVNLWTGEFAAFRQVIQQDNPDNFQFSVRQFIAVYPDANVAAETFRRGFAPDLAGRCGAVTLTDSGGGQWRLDRIAIAGNRASWMNAFLQGGQDTTWRCANEVRLKGNVMFMEVECQYGNGSSLTAQMANTTANRIP